MSMKYISKSRICLQRSVCMQIGRAHALQTTVCSSTTPSSSRKAQRSSQRLAYLRRDVVQRLVGSQVHHSIFVVVHHLRMQRKPLSEHSAQTKVLEPEGLASGKAKAKGAAARGLKSWRPRYELPERLHI